MDFEPLTEQFESNSDRLSVSKFDFDFEREIKMDLQNIWLHRDRNQCKNLRVGEAQPLISFTVIHSSAAFFVARDACKHYVIHSH